MANKNQKSAEVDELLGDSKPAAENGAGQPTEAEIAEINAAIEAKKAEIAELKAKAKGTKVKVPRELKGEMVTFTNKAGDRITGLGVLYYVARYKGKLHYKEASQVTKMTDAEIAEWNASQESAKA